MLEEVKLEGWKNICECVEWMEREEMKDQTAIA